MATLPSPSTVEEDLALAWERHQAGDLRRAEQGYRRILRSQSRIARVWFCLGQLCEADRRPVEAVACFRQALEIEPGEAEGHFLLGNALLAQSKWPEAETAYRRCVDFRPEHVPALVNLGFVLGEQDRLDDAKEIYERALALRPEQPEIPHNLANVFREQGHLDRALVLYDDALRLRPDYSKALVNRGVALVAMNRLDEAIRDLEQGAQLQPDLPEAHTSLGAALSVKQRFDEAFARYERALELSPDHAEAAWNRSLLQLLIGDYRRGWPGYEWRWRCKRTTPLPAFGPPRWDGSPLTGRTILLYAEQGLGDTLHFVRYAPLVKERGGRVVLQCQGVLLRLLSRTQGIDHLVAWGVAPPPFDVWAPLMSLPALFGTTLETIPAACPYVLPDPDLVSQWRHRLAPVRGFRVGIAWQGSPRHAWDRHRSVSLEQFEPLARVEGVQLISLQKGVGSEQLPALEGRFPVVNLGDQFDEMAGPFMDTAAILANLDLVITIDSSLAHLAGAMGVPALLALTFTPDWRWLLGRPDSPWYPSLRLFRQHQPGDWPGVFVRLAEELAKEVNVRPLLRPITIEVSAGELLDKLTILEIKSERITDPDKLRHVRDELILLAAVRQGTLPATPELSDLADQLKAVNQKLWQIEDDIRLCEREGRFDEQFIGLARSVYRENDRRATLKHAINVLLGSALIEQKSYASYTPDSLG